MNGPFMQRIAQGLGGAENSVILPIIIGVFFVIVIIFVIYAIIKF